MNLTERIIEIYDEFTASERRLAILLLEAPEQLLSRGAAEIAKRAAVSSSTAARFFRRLGYSGYREALAEMRVAQPEAPDHLARFKLTRTSQAAHLKTELQNLKWLVDQINSEDIELTVSKIVQAEKIWVIGFGDSYPLALLTRVLMSKVKGAIHVLPSTGDGTFDEFASIKAHDAVIAIGVGDKLQSVRSAMRLARASGAHVTFITNQSFSAEGTSVDAVIRCSTRAPGLFASAVAPVSIITYVSSAVAMRIGQPAIERLEHISNFRRAWEGALLDGS